MTNPTPTVERGDLAGLIEERAQRLYTNLIEAGQLVDRGAIDIITQAIRDAEEAARAEEREWFLGQIKWLSDSDERADLVASVNAAIRSRQAKEG